MEDDDIDILGDDSPINSSETVNPPANSISSSTIQTTLIPPSSTKQDDDYLKHYLHHADDSDLQLQQHLLLQHNNDHHLTHHHDHHSSHHHHHHHHHHNTNTTTTTTTTSSDSNESSTNSSSSASSSPSHSEEESDESSSVDLSSDDNDGHNHNNNHHHSHSHGHHSKPHQHHAAKSLHELKSHGSTTKKLSDQSDSDDSDDYSSSSSPSSPSPPPPPTSHPKIVHKFRQEGSKTVHMMPKPTTSTSTTSTTTSTNNSSPLMTSSPNLSTNTTTNNKGKTKTVRIPWTKEEESLYIEGAQRHGKDYRKIQELVKTKTIDQIRSHGQKVALKLKRHNISDPSEIDKITKKNNISSTHSSSNLPSHNMQWSDHEHNLFLEGMKIYGRSKWIPIAEHIGSRNSLQVKNHARIFFRKMKQAGESLDEFKYIKKKSRGTTGMTTNKSSSSFSSSTKQAKKQQLDSDDDETIIIEHNPDNSVKSERKTSITSKQPAQEDEEIDIDDDQDVKTTVHTNVNNKHNTEYHHKTIDHSIESETDNQDDYEDESSNDYEDPTDERYLPEDQILDEEIEGCDEFFKGAQSKTPERYLKIRNTIISHWNRVRPHYLSKTVARNQVKSCGDVNAIGRVHNFLESIGVINFGAIDAPTRPRKRSHPHHHHNGSKSNHHIYQYTNVSGYRKRKVLLNGEWIDEDIDQNFTVVEGNDDYEDDDDDYDQPYKKKKQYSHYLDPFTLIECNKYNSSAGNPPPFTLDVSVNTLVTMDIHSHIASTEVIGMLGGKYDHTLKHISVHLAIPCNSLSSDIQCDMDPNSLIAARDLVTSMDLDIVGWYHSHPNFPPIPSLRDIETQSSYQKLFGRENIEPFVGVIVNPYHQPDTNNSIINYITVSNNLSENKMFRLPFELTTTITKCINDTLLFDQMENIFNKYINYQFRMNLHKVYNQDTKISYLEKMVQSLKNTFSKDPSQTKVSTTFHSKFIDRLNQLFIQFTDTKKHDNKINNNTTEQQNTIVSIESSDGLKNDDDKEEGGGQVVVGDESKDVESDYTDSDESGIEIIAQG